MDTPQQLLHNFQDIISDDTTGLANLIVAIKGLNTYFEQAKRKNADKTYQIIASIIMGIKENRDISDRESYDAFVSHRKRTSNYLKNKDADYFDKLDFADRVIEDFKNAYELDKKILVRLVCIDRLLKDKKIDIENIYFQDAGRLLTELDQSRNNWNFWTDLLDRRIRNASSHLDFYYDEKSQIFRGKDIVKVKYKGKTRKKVNRFSISPEEFLYETLPNAVNASQSFWAAGILLCLEPYPEYYNKALAMLNEDN